MAKRERTETRPTMHLLIGAFSPGKSAWADVVTGGATDLPYIDAERIQMEELRDGSPEGRRRALDEAERRRLACLARGQSFILEPNFSELPEGELVRQAKAANFAADVHHFMAADPPVLAAQMREQAGAPVDEEALLREYERSAVACHDAVLRADTAMVLDASGPGLPEPVLIVEHGEAAPLRQWLPVAMLHLYAPELLRMQRAAEEASRRAPPPPGRDEPTGPPLPMYFGEVVGENRDSWFLDAGIGVTKIKLRKDDVPELRLRDCYAVGFPMLLQRAVRGVPLHAQESVQPAGEAEVRPLTMSELLKGRDRRRLFLTNPEEARDLYPDTAHAYAALEYLDATLPPDRPDLRDLALEYMANLVQLGAVPRWDPESDRDMPWDR